MEAINYRRASSIFTISIILIIVGLIFFIALINSAYELALLSIIVFAFVGAAKLWANLSHYRIKSSIIINKNRLFADDTLSLTVNTDNYKFLPVSIQVHFQSSKILHSFFCDTALEAEDTLLWNKSLSFNWKLHAKFRGVYDIGPLRIVSGDLFGFFVREVENQKSIRVIVYPRLVKLRPFTIPGRDFFGVPGGKHPVHDPVYILGTADYHYSRPAKYIHWKASARHCRLQEKIFDSTEQEKVLIVIDTEQFAKNFAAEAFERTLEVAASMTVHLKRRGSSVGFASNGIMTGEVPSVVPISRISSQLGSILETMARLKMEPREVLIDFLRQAVRVPSGTTCVYFSYEEDDAARAVKEYFRRRKTPVVFYTYKEILSLRGDKSDDTAHGGTGEEARAV